MLEGALVGNSLGPRRSTRWPRRNWMLTGNVRWKSYELGKDYRSSKVGDAKEKYWKEGSVEPLGMDIVNSFGR